MVTDDPAPPAETRSPSLEEIEGVRFATSSLSPCLYQAEARRVRSPARWIVLAVLVLVIAAAIAWRVLR